MALIPGEWMLPFAVVVAGLVVDQLWFGGRHLNQIISSFLGNSYEKFTLVDGAHFRGQPIGNAELLGFTRRGDKEIERWKAVHPNGTSQAFNEDDIHIPFRALTKGRLEGFEIQYWPDKVKLYTQEIDSLKSQLDVQRAKSSLAFQNAMDFTTSMMRSFGDWKKEIGSTLVVANKTKDGYGYQQDVQKQEGHDEG